MSSSTLIGQGIFAWQSDYGQFYLVDSSEAIVPPIDITDDMVRDGLVAPDTGVVVYTQDCLQQHVRISLYDAEPAAPPVEPMSGRPWTRSGLVDARFPAQSFGLSSPSMPALPAGPVFLLATPSVRVRVCWMECPDSRDDSVPIEPDVIDIAVWPR